MLAGPGQHDRRQSAADRHRLDDGRVHRVLPAAVARAGCSPNDGPRWEGVRLDREHSIEIAFLAVATIYSLTLPLKHSITLFDAAILVTIFVLYTIRVSRAPAEEPHLVGPARLRRAPSRRWDGATTVISIAVFAAAVILLVAERFAEALVASGEALGVSEFLLVQWVAPLASEAPELLVAGSLRMAPQHQRRPGHAGQLQGEPVDAAGRHAADRVRDRVGRLPRAAARRGAARGAVPDGGAVVLRRRGALEPHDVACARPGSSSRCSGSSSSWARSCPSRSTALERIGVGIVYLVLGTWVLVRDRGNASRAVPGRVPSLLRRALGRATRIRVANVELPALSSRRPVACARGSPRVPAAAHPRSRGGAVVGARAGAAGAAPRDRAVPRGPARAAGLAAGAAGRPRAVRPPGGRARGASRRVATSSWRPARPAARRWCTTRRSPRRHSPRPKATALYLYPTKALARDQLRAVRALKIPQVKAAVYDGDTPRAERPLIRKNANLVMTNPDMLHLSLLPDHARWADFLFRLSIVVVDEAHVCRGVFGSHVSMVLRRLQRLIAHYGGSPRWCLASATVGNPGELATRLTGRSFEEIVGRRVAARREALRPVEPADRGRGHGATAQRAERGLVADGQARRRRGPHDRVHAVPAGRRAARRVRPPRGGRAGDARRASRATGPATSPRTGVASSASSPTASCWRSPPPARWSWASTSARSTRPCSRATRARAPRCGSRWGEPAVATPTRSRSWWPRTTRSTSTSCTTPPTCSNVPPKPP